MWLKKAMVYLGLDDEDYEDAASEEGDEGDRRQRPPSRHPRAAGSPSGPDEPSGIGTVRPINPRSEQQDPSQGTGQNVKTSGSSTSGPQPSGSRSQVVRPIAVTPNAKPYVVTPSSFNQAQEVADKYKGSLPVVMNLQAIDRDLSRRLIDFASGLCYGLGGQMERVANQVYLLTPTNVEVSPEERRRLHERGYDA